MNVNVMDAPVWGEIYIGSGRLTGKCDHTPHAEDEQSWVKFDNLDQWYRQWRWDNHDMNHASHCADWQCPYCVRDFLMPTRDEEQRAKKQEVEQILARWETPVTKVWDTPEEDEAWKDL